ncbi:MAG: hypothetical protein ACI9SI_000582 [Polaribacter sp.]|jgi:hypothetical protein
MGFTTWHKSILQKVQKTTGLNDYQILWIAFLKGVLIGGLIVYFYMR